MVISKKLIQPICVITMMLITPYAKAGLLTFSFTDEVNDPLGCLPNSTCNIPFASIVGTSTDLLDMTFIFDDQTGDYTITVNSTESNPFLGDVRLNINLYNSFLDTFFYDNVNDFFYAVATTQIILVGQDINLLSWSNGQLIASCEGPGGKLAQSCVNGLGAPNNFSAGVYNFNGNDVSAADSFQTSAPAMVVRAVAEPSSKYLFIITMLLILLRRLNSPKPRFIPNPSDRF